jgi:D-serine deaminase-like pyridoxal phosphate-dependent protein
MEYYPVQNYTYYKEIFKGVPMPFAFVDIDLFDKNTEDIIKRAGNKKIRIASKSIRCLELIKKILASNTVFQGIMCYHPLEAVYLSEQGFNDLLIAYPIYSYQHISAICKEIKKGKSIIAMVDLPEHAEQLNRIAEQESCIIPVCMDIDMSSDFGGLHFGVRRSNITTVAHAKKLGEQIKTLKNVRLDGVMGYEAQIAGVGDSTDSVAKNLVIPVLKKRSIKELALRRAAIVNELQAQGHQLKFVNGGGTGSMETTIEESCVTEITVGSGFYSPGLFDHYKQFHHLPAAAYAIEITRKPCPDVYTCYGGGYTASGSMEKNKLPKPYLPYGAKLLDTEGAGEVQTPVVYKGIENLKLGDPVFMRHAKAGELCERFNTLLLVKEGKIINEVKTYRGESLCFL